MSKRNTSQYPIELKTLRNTKLNAKNSNTYIKNTKCKDCSSNASKQKENDALKTLLPKRLKSYRDKIIKILTPGWFSSKKLNLQEIQQIAKFLPIIDKIYSTSGNREIGGNIYMYLNKKIKAKFDETKSPQIDTFFNIIQYTTGDKECAPEKCINVVFYDKIKSEFINVLNKLPAP